MTACLQGFNCGSRELPTRRENGQESKEGKNLKGEFPDPLREILCLFSLGKLKRPTREI